MTSKEKFESKIVGMSAFLDIFPIRYSTKSVSDKVSFLERALLATEMLNKTIQSWMPVIEFLIWIKNNLFDSKGRFSFPITKWIDAYRAIRNMIKKMTE